MRRIAIVLVIAALGTGCALGISGPRPGAPVSENPRCDSGRGLVFADGLLGGLFALGGAAAIGEDEAGAGLGLAALGGLMVASAVRGNNAARACERAQTAYAGYVKTLERKRVGKPRRDGAPAKVATQAFVPAENDRKLPTPKQAATALTAGAKPVRPEAGTGTETEAGAETETETEAETGSADWSAFWEVAP